MGRTLHSLGKQCEVGDIELLTANIVKRKTVYSKVPAGEEWRPDIVAELLKLRTDSLSVDGLTSAEIQDMLDFVCTS